MLPAPRARYLVEGPTSQSSTDLLALVLDGGTGRSLGLARELLERFGTVKALALEPPAALMEVPGVGASAAVRVHAACALASRPPPARWAAPLGGPEAAVRFLRPHLSQLPHEELHALYLDRRLRVKAHRRLTVGSEGHTIVDPRQVLRPAVMVGAGMVLLAHNHPSGDPTPSAQDVQVTRRVAEAAAVLDVRLVDHLVLGEPGWTSLAAEGVLAPWEPRTLGLA